MVIQRWYRPGDPVRVFRGVKPSLLGFTFTVRTVLDTGVVVDNGWPGDSDFATNGATVRVRLPFESVSDWARPERNLTPEARLVGKLHAAEKEISRLKALLEDK